mmetsp:Transcript_16386/g.26593  ORF Transcript_16386/g.26593 Transcript_16386/m.26593 type:complete len:205 (-) Transcript_16386:321-935(-)|eukprot:jgi/Bigna1/47124/estExt_Genewise1.C_100092
MPPRLSLQSILFPSACVLTIVGMIALGTGSSNVDVSVGVQSRSFAAPSMSAISGLRASRTAHRPYMFEVDNKQERAMKNSLDRSVKVNNFLEGLFGGNAGGAGGIDAQPMICVDCGFIYKKKNPSFAELPNSYKCPACGVGKNRFKVFKEQSDYYNTLAAEKAAKRAKGPVARSSKRAELVRKQQEMQRKKDEQKGRGGGWFGN